MKIVTIAVAIFYIEFHCLSDINPRNNNQTQIQNATSVNGNTSTISNMTDTNITNGTSNRPDNSNNQPVNSSMAMEVCNQTFCVPKGISKINYFFYLSIFSDAQ